MAQTVLVTGGAGYIGSVLVPKLVAAGKTVKVIDRLYWGTDSISSVADSIEIIEGDVRNIPDAALDGVDAIIHLAGLSNDPTADFAPEANWQMNAIASQALAKKCLENGIKRLVFGSTCSIYDGLPSGVIYDETAEVNPRGAYATSKAFAEKALLEASEQGLETVILRQGTVYGPSLRLRYDLVVQTMLKDALSKRQLQLHGGGYIYRPMVDIRDTTTAFMLCAEAPAENVQGQIFNVVHLNYQVRELAQEVQQVLKKRGVEVELVDAPAPDLVRDYRCSNEKLTNAIGFTPGVSVGESVEDLMQFVETHHMDDFDNDRYYNIRWLTPMKDQLTSFS
jgi:nucleoside-diphosphate-sugar epimerase